MKFTTAFLALSLLLVGAEAHNHMHKRHARRGPSAVYSATTATSTAAAAVTTTTSSTTTSERTKRGLAFNEVDVTSLFSNSKICWAYNWDSAPPTGLLENVVYYPMLWSSAEDHTANWEVNANAAITAGATHIFGFNEPDLSTQANMTAAEAAAAWLKYVEPFAGKAKLVSPAVTNGASPMGTAWLDDFIDACSSCTIDAIAIHIYDAASNTAYFQNYISSVGTKYSKPVFVTEFGASGTDAEQVTFLTTMLPYLDSLSSVEGYAYYYADTLVSNLVLDVVGAAYNTL